MTTPQLVSAVVGAVLCLGSLVSFVRQKSRRFKALFWMAIGVAMVYAAFRPHIIETMGKDSDELRLRLMVMLLSFIVLTVTLEAIRIARIQERYAFLWLATGLVLLVGSLFEGVGLAITRATGLRYDMTVVVVLFAFVVLMLFSFSAALSAVQDKLSQVARELALAEERLRRVELGRRGDSDPAEAPSPALPAHPREGEK